MEAPYTDPMPTPAAAPCTVCGEAFDTIDACATLCAECQRCEDEAAAAQYRADVAYVTAHAAAADLAERRALATMSRAERAAYWSRVAEEEEHTQDRLLA